ncbi:MAG: hypothetical protein GY707_01150, partial [Desulfobacteraceae bacterium]|nr:hypothetical protein [Desulfobacteraceae bacterium]
MTQNLIHQKNDNTFKIIIGIIVIICTVIIIVFVINKKEQSDISIQSVQQKPSIQKKITAEPEPAPAPSPKPVINYNELEKNEVLKKTMQQRKKKYDIKNSLDLIVSSNEIFMIKNYEISMAEVLKSAALKRGDVVEESIGNDEKNKDIKQYGIYVVKPGDNIWNIHFNIL